MTGSQPQDAERVERFASILRFESSTLQDARVLQPKASLGKVLSAWSPALSAISYISTSLAMTTLTKYAASTWRFPGSSSLLLVECCATVVALRLSASAGVYQPFRADIIRHLPLVTLAKALNMYLSFMAMRLTSLPVYNVLKRLQPVYALLQDHVIRGSVPLPEEMIAVLLMCAGTVVTGSGDLDFDVFGYAAALLAAACQSLYLVLARRAQDQIPGLSSTDLLYYTAFFNSVLFAPLTCLELPEVATFLQGEGQLQSLARFLLPYVAMGAFLNYATFWCTSANSPLATAVCGSAKGVLSTIVGVIAFGAQLTTIGWVGWLSSAAGGLLYSLARSPSSKAKQT